MTDEEAVKAFQKEIIDCKSDAEGKHDTGDCFVSDILREHGFPLLAAEYNKQKKGW